MLNKRTFACDAKILGITFPMPIDDFGSGFFLLSKIRLLSVGIV
jgi:EAL domain-containing protein (putative c-di-GMP-specific phosphodiesterase class I)